MLWRALNHVDKGFYIDVGANDPEIDSVTKAFYDCGWCGVNIEPVSEWFEKLEQARPHDVNLKVAAGARKSWISFYEILNTGLSTANDKFARDAQKKGFNTRKTQVPVTQLARICEQYVHSDIHFLKIDVEGAEESVIRGMDFSKFRPWILLIEANQPNSKVETYQKWEHLVLEVNYLLAYKDGLNRFYIAKEHSELLDALRYPPNVFDNYLGADVVNLRSALASTEAKLSSIELQSFELGLQNDLLLNSASWRMTAPFRSVSRLVKKMKSRIIAVGEKTILLMILFSKRSVERQTWLKKWGSRILMHFPSLNARLRCILSHINSRVQRSKK